MWEVSGMCGGHPGQRAAAEGVVVPGCGTAIGLSLPIRIYRPFLGPVLCTYAIVRGWNPNMSNRELSKKS